MSAAGRVLAVAAATLIGVAPGVAPCAAAPAGLLPPPVDPAALPAAEAQVPYVLGEPGMDRLLPYLLERHVAYRVFLALQENAAGEHAARMAAMDSASKNIDALCANYTLLRNRARQASITTELIEVVWSPDSTYAESGV